MRDGTYGIRKLRVTGRTKHARATGVLIRNDRARSRYVVSAGGSTLVIRKAAAVRRLASVGSVPRIGDKVFFTLEIAANGTIEADEVEVLGKVGRPVVRQLARLVLVRRRGRRVDGLLERLFGQEGRHVIRLLGGSLEWLRLDASGAGFGGRPRSRRRAAPAWRTWRWISKVRGTICHPKVVRTI